MNQITNNYHQQKQQITKDAKQVYLLGILAIIIALAIAIGDYIQADKVQVCFWIWTAICLTLAIILTKQLKALELAELKQSRQGQGQPDQQSQPLWQRNKKAWKLALGYCLLLISWTIPMQISVLMIWPQGKWFWPINLSVISQILLTSLLGFSLWAIYKLISYKKKNTKSQLVNQVN